MATINATSTSCISTTTTTSIPNSSYTDTTTSIPFSQIFDWKEL